MTVNSRQPVKVIQNSHPPKSSESQGKRGRLCDHPNPPASESKAADGAAPPSTSQSMPESSEVNPNEEKPEVPAKVLIIHGGKRFECDPKDPVRDKEPRKKNCNKS